MSLTRSQRKKAASIRLKSCDNEIFDVQLDVIECSDRLMDAAKMYADRKDVVIPLLYINGDILRRILAWANYHKGNFDDSILLDKSMHKIHPWDRVYLGMDISTLFAIIRATEKNFLNISALKLAATKIVAGMMIEKSTQELREMFQIEAGHVENIDSDVDI